MMLKTFFGPAALLVLLSPFNAMSAPLPDDFSVKYSFEFAGLNAGHLTKHITRTGDNHYTLHSDTEPSGLAKMMLGSKAIITEEASFDLEGDNIRPMEYRVKQESKGGYDRKVVFDWKQKILKYKNGKVEPMPAGPVMDAGSVFFSFMPRAGGKIDVQNDRIFVTDGRRTTGYTYQRVEDQTITTKAGKFKCVVIQRDAMKSDKLNRVTIWLAYDKGLAPVKLVKVKAGKPKTVLEAVSIEGL
ncbi:MAG: hypothetical protein DSZ33_01030 [Gammaproteobacteria bacterium]|nr:MAG: hypothetical protein DSZ33_01030 [Gammaproteobacteria bacterium]